MQFSLNLLFTNVCSIMWYFNLGQQHFEYVIMLTAFKTCVYIMLAELIIWMLLIW